MQIRLDHSTLGPEALLKGTVSWDFEALPTTLTLNILWETSGKGTDDSETVHAESWKPDSQKGERAFQFALPRGPISVQGNLISIRWYVECTSKRPNANARVPFVLSHLDSFVRLQAIAK